MNKSRCGSFLPEGILLLPLRSWNDSFELVTGSSSQPVSSSSSSGGDVAAWKSWDDDDEHGGRELACRCNPLILKWWVIGTQAFVTVLNNKASSSNVTTRIVLRVNIMEHVADCNTLHYYAAKVRLIPWFCSTATTIYPYTIMIYNIVLG